MPRMLTLPAKGDKFYDENRLQLRKEREDETINPNGEIVEILYTTDPPEYRIKFVDGEYVTYHDDQLYNKWTDMFGGCWYLQQETDYAD